MSNDKDDKNNTKEDDNIIRIPTLKERDRIAREKREAEKRAKKKSPWAISYKGNEWKSGDGSKVNPNSTGNSGFRKKEAFFNTGNIPPFTKNMIIAFVIIHILTSLIIPKATVWDIYQTFAFIPGMFTGAAPMQSLLNLLSPITHVFLHAGWTHLMFNTVTMVAFGIFTEKRLGTKAAAFFFFAGGALGALAFLLLQPGSETQLMGASGGISALFGVMMITMHSENRFGRLNKLGKSPWPIIGIWCAIMLATGLMGGDNIAWQAHIAGFLSGTILYRLMQKGHLRL